MSFWVLSWYNASKTGYQIFIQKELFKKKLKNKQTKKYLVRFEESERGPGMVVYTVPSVDRAWYYHFVLLTSSRDGTSSFWGLFSIFLKPDNNFIFHFFEISITFEFILAIIQRMDKIINIYLDIQKKHQKCLK